MTAVLDCFTSCATTKYCIDQSIPRLVLTEKQSVFETRIPALADTGPAELGLHSIHSYGYASHSSLAGIANPRCEPIMTGARSGVASAFARY